MNIVEASQPWPRSFSNPGTTAFSPKKGTRRNSASQQDFQQSTFKMQLAGFGSRNDEQDLTYSFVQFINGSGLHDFFQAVSSHPVLSQLLNGIDVKIDRQKATWRPNLKNNVYGCSLVKHDFGFVGSNASNHSRSIGDKIKLPDSDLTKLLDTEQWISKIILHFDGQSGMWTVTKFGTEHALRRGMGNIGKVATYSVPMLL